MVDVADVGDISTRPKVRYVGRLRPLPAKPGLDGVMREFSVREMVPLEIKADVLGCQDHLTRMAAGPLAFWRGDRVPSSRLSISVHRSARGRRYLSSLGWFVEPGWNLNL